MHWTKVHLKTFFLSDMFHHKVLDQGFRVSAVAPASNLRDNALVIAPLENPSENYSTSLVSLCLCFLPAVRLNEGGVGP